MFEDLASNILTRILGDYIDETTLDPKSLKIAVQQGNVLVHDLKVKPTALDAFELPIVVTWGYVGEVFALVPWNSLGSSPVKVRIRDVYLCVQPRKCSHWNSAAEKERQREAKKTRLKNYELKRISRWRERYGNGGGNVDQSKKQDDELQPSRKNNTFLSRITETILNNLQLCIENIHIRYEDTSSPDRPIVFGALLESFVAVSCNEDWQEVFISNVQNQVYKSAALHGLMVYMNRGDGFLSSSHKNLIGFRDAMKTFAKVIPEEKFKPVFKQKNIATRAILQKEGAINPRNPRLRVFLMPGKSYITLDDTQYLDILITAEYMLAYKKYERFREIRPMNLGNIIHSAMSRKRLWKFAITAAKKTLEGQKFTWNDFETRKKNRERYTELFKRSKHLSFIDPLTEEERNELDDLESVMSTKDCIFARRIAEQQLEEEKLKHPGYYYRTKTNQSWLEWLLGYNYQKDAALEDLEISNEQREELNREIGYDESEATSWRQFPPDYVQARFEFQLNSCVMTLVDSQYNKNIIRAEGTDLQIIVGVRNNSSIVSQVTLGGLVIKDHYTSDTYYPHILSKYPTRASREQSNEKKNLVSISIETNPVSRDTDLALDIVLGRMNVIVNVPLFQRLISFFCVPTTVDLSFFEEKASKTFDTFRQQLRAQLSSALQNRVSYELYMKIEAPAFIIPTEPKSKSKPILMIDFGILAIKSMTNHFSRKQRVLRGIETEDDMYDDFSLNFQGIQVSMINYQQLKREQFIRESDTQILEKVSAQLLLQILITDNTEFPITKLTAETEKKIDASLSPQKLKTIMEAVNNLIQLASMPSGTRYTSLLADGYLKIRDAGHDKLFKNERYWVEFRADGNLFVFEKKGAEQQMASFYIKSAYVDLLNYTRDRRIGRNEMVLVLPQKNGTELKFIFTADDQDECEHWYNLLHYCIIVSHHSASINVKEKQGKTERKNSAQLWFALDFKIASLSLLLRYEESSMDSELYKEQTLSEISGQDVGIRLGVTEHDITTDITLGSAYLKDYINSITENYILRSNNDVLKKDSVAARFVVVFDDESTYADRHSDYILDVHFDSVNFLFDPVMTSALIQVVFYFVSIPETLYIPPVYTASSSEPNATKDNWTLFQLNTSMQRLAVVLSEYGSMIAELSAENATIVYEIDDRKSVIEGRLDNLILLSKLGKTVYQEIIGVKSRTDESLLTFAYEQNAETVGNPAVTTLRAHFAHTRIVYLQSFISKLQSFIYDGPLVPTLSDGYQRATKKWKERPDIPEKTVTGEAKFIYFLSCSQPHIIIPASKMSRDCLVLNLGDIAFDNSENSPANMDQTFSISVSGVNLKTKIQSKSHNFVAKFSFKVNVEFSPLGRADNKAPELRVTGSVDQTINIEIDQLDIILFTRILKENIAEPIRYPNRQKQHLFIICSDPNSVLSDILGLGRYHPNHPKGEAMSPVLLAPTPLNDHDDGANTDSFFKSYSYYMKFDLNRIAVLFRRADQADLLKFDLHCITVGFDWPCGGRSNYFMRINSISAVDVRPSVPMCFRKIIHSQTSTSGYSYLDFKFFSDENQNEFAFDLQNTSIMLTTDLIQEFNRYTSTLQIRDTNTSPRSSGTIPSESDLIISCDTVFGEDITLNPSRKLRIKRNTKGSVVIEGQGHMIDLFTKQKEQLIEVDGGMKLIFKDVILRYSMDLEDLLAYDPKLSEVDFTDAFHEKIIPYTHERLVLEASPTESRITPGRQSKKVTIVKGKFGDAVVSLPDTSRSDCSSEHTFCFSLSGCIELSMKKTEFLLYILLKMSAYSLTREKEKPYLKTTILSPLGMEFSLHEFKESGNDMDHIQRKIVCQLDDVDCCISNNLVRTVAGIYNTVRIVAGKERPASEIHDTSDYDVIDDLESDIATFEQFFEVRSEKDSHAQTSPHRKAVHCENDFQLQRIGRLQVVVFDHFNGVKVPLTSFKMDNVQVSNMRMTSVDQQMVYTADMETRLSVDYYNQLRASYEPAIEPWSFRVNAELRTAPLYYRVYVSGIDINQFLNFNISRAMVNALSTTYDRLTNVSHMSSVSIVDLPSNTIRNHTGTNVHIVLENRLYHLQPWENLDISSLQCAGDKRMYIGVHIPEYYTNENLIDVSVPKTLLLAGNPTEYKTVLDVELQHGRKVVTLFSGCKVINWTSLPLSLNFEGNNLIHVLAPNESLGAPLKTNFSLSCKPNLTDAYASFVQFDYRAAPGRYVISCGSTSVVTHTTQMLGYVRLDISAPIRIYNKLPCPIRCVGVCSSSNAPMLAMGDYTDIFDSVQNGFVLRMAGYMSDPIDLLTKPNCVMFRECDCVINIDYHEKKNGQFEAYFYAQYLMIDHTGLQLFVSGGRQTLISNDDQGTQIYTLNISSRPLTPRIRVLVADSKPSDKLKLDRIGFSGHISLPILNRRNLSIGYDINIGKDVLYRSTIVTFAPRHIIFNNSSISLRFREVHSSEELKIDSNHYMYLPYSDKKDIRGFMYIQFTTEDEQYSWSAPLVCSHAGEYSSKILRKQLSREGEHEALLFSVLIEQKQGAWIMSLFETKEFPYQIFNHTNELMYISQTDVGRWWTIGPGSYLSYAWEVSEDEHQIQIKIRNEKSDPIELDNITTVRLVSLPNGDQLKCVFDLKGTVIEAHIYEDTPLPRFVNTVSAINFCQIPTQASCFNTHNVSFIAFGAAHIGVSLIDDSVPQEILFMSFENTVAKISSKGHYYTADLSIQRAQIDNQTNDDLYPVFISQNPCESSSNPFLQASVTVVPATDIYPTVFPYLSLRLSELNFTAEYSLIEKLVAVFTDLLYSDSTATQPTEELLRRPTPDTSITDPKQLQFLFVKFYPIKLNVSVRLDRDQHEARYDVTNVNWLFTYMDKLHLRTTSIRHAPLYFEGITICHPLLTPTTLTNRLTTHYAQELSDNLFKLVGSWNAIGRPVGIASKFYSKHKTSLTDNEYADAHNLDDIQEFTKICSTNKNEMVRYDLEEYLRMNTIQQPEHARSSSLNLRRETGIAIFAGPLKQMRNEQLQKLSLKNFMKDSRIRLPRAFLNYSVLTNYQAPEAFSDYVMRQICKNNPSMNGEKAWFVVSNHIVTHLFVITNNYLLKVKFSDYTVRWRYSLRSIVKVKHKYPTIILYMQEPFHTIPNRGKVTKKRIQHPLCQNVDSFVDRVQLAIQEEQNNRKYLDQLQATSNP